MPLLLLLLCRWMQSTPLPMKSVLHAQLRLPAEFVQSASALHPPFAVAHSLCNTPTPTPTDTHSDQHAHKTDSREEEERGDGGRGVRVCESESGEGLTHLTSVAHS